MASEAAAAARSAGTLPEPFRVIERMDETSDTATLVLDAAGRPGGFSFAPGQFNMVYLFGAGEVPISVSGDPALPHLLVHTIRAAGSVTRPLAAARPGDRIGIRGPYGNPWPLAEAKGQDVVVASGGLGIAPLRPAIYHILAHRADYARFILLHGARTPADILYPKEIAEWRGRFDLEVHVTVDRAEGGWRGQVGVVTTLFPRIVFDPARTVALICGPEVMMRFTIREFQNRGVPDERIFVSVERNMKCGMGLCGHCQLGPRFICREGPVLRYDRIAPFFGKREF
ncbi:MAG: FAD/NAD(P)-binding protein [Planctomycetes bacterium]|nr:FAD/NAD(P)-binding protein [Planctomycetota bacterium]